MPEKDTKKADDKGWIYIVAYLFAPLSSIILYLIEKENKKIKFHAMQSLLLGIVAIVLDFTFILSIFGFILWLYGLYVGYKEYTGETIKIPVIGEYAEKNV